MSISTMLCIAINISYLSTYNRLIFNSLKKFHNPLIVSGCDTWQDYIKGYTDFDYFINSKQLRQAIFGNLNMKTQKSIMKWLTVQILEMLLEDFEIISCKNDEIIIATSEEKCYDDYLRITSMRTKFNVPVKVEAFYLIQLKPFPFFVKEIFTNLPDKSIKSPAFKSIPPTFFPQCYKHYFGMEVNSNDLKSYVEGLICTIDEPLQFERINRTN